MTIAPPRDEVPPAPLADPPGPTWPTWPLRTLLVAVRTALAPDHLLTIAEEALDRQAGVHLLHVVAPPAGPGSCGEPGPVERQVEADRLLAVASAELTALLGGLVPVTTEVAHLEEPAAAIARRAQEQTVLVVLPPSSPGRGHTPQIAAAVTERCAAPLLVLPPSDTGGRAQPVTVGVRSPDIADAALRASVAVARRRGTGLVVVHACPAAANDARRGVTRHLSDLGQALERLRTTVATVLHDFPDVSTELVATVMSPADALAEAGARSAVLVLGHGPTPVTGHGDLLGETLRRVARPVMVVCDGPTGSATSPAPEGTT